MGALIHVPDGVAADAQVVLLWCPIVFGCPVVVDLMLLFGLLSLLATSSGAGRVTPIKGHRVSELTLVAGWRVCFYSLSAIDHRFY